MGLDMYLTGRLFHWRCYPNRGDERREGGKKVKHIDVELGYWRKHPDLHGFIVKEFASGIDDCKEIELTADNLRTICAAVKNQKLPKTSGFFFGSSDGSADEIANDLLVLHEAIQWLQQSDPDPFEETRTVTENAGFTFTSVALKTKADADTKNKPQRVSRSVHYEASW